MGTTYTPTPDDKVEWTHVLSEISRVYLVGTVLDRRSNRLTNDQKKQLINDKELVPVTDPTGEVWLVLVEDLAPIGEKDRQRHQANLDKALANLRAAQRAVATARDSVTWIVGFEGPEDATDATVTMDSVEQSLRDVSRILRVNGAK